MKLIQLDLMSSRTPGNLAIERTLYPVKGFVPTPSAVVDLMVAKLFRDRPPTADTRVLDPGCGTGAFIHGIRRWCKQQGHPLPQILGVESNPAHVAECRNAFCGSPQITIRHADFLGDLEGTFDYIIGNPPYVPITGLSEDERRTYRENYVTAQGRFDLYILFWEQALRHLAPAGRQVFITPEKFLYVETAAPLRGLLNGKSVEEIHFLDEETFGELVTYPVVTTVAGTRNGGHTNALLRDGSSRTLTLPLDSASWLPTILGAQASNESRTLADVCIRISCGVATGADQVFVVRKSELSPDLHEFAYPTLAGRDIKEAGTLPTLTRVMLLPYDSMGSLLPESELGALHDYISEPKRKEKLLSRTCVQRKPWYAFHETPPLREVLRPKILCKDIGAKPMFVTDRTGQIVPRHTVYYIVPKPGVDLDDLASHLNSKPAADWLDSHCQRAANGFLRLQSHILKDLPLHA